MTDRWTQGWRWWVLGALIAAAYLTVGLRAGIPACPEALVRDGLCRRLVDNQTAGRQGLVSSAWWGPAVSLGALPAAYLMKRAPAGLAPVAASAVFGAAALLLLERAMRRRGAGSWRLGLVAAVGLTPMFVRECTNGSSTTLVTALLVLAADRLTGWIEARRLRDLIWLGLALALLLLTGVDAWGWVLVALVTLGVVEARHPREPGERRAVMVLALLPPLYAMGLWTLLCWLIMGDPFYLARSLATEGPGPGREFALPGLLAGWYGALMGAAVLTACLALARRRRGEVPLALLVLALPASAGVLAWRGWLWSPTPLFAALPALLALGVAGILHERRRAAMAGWGLTAAMLGAGVCLSVCPPSASLPRTGTAAAQPAAPWLPDLERHVRARSRYATVFVCGYDSLALLRDVPAGTFVPSLDFNFDKLKRDYYGQALFVLVRRPDAVHATESVLRRYPRFFIQGGPDTLYDSDWGAAGEWRLFEMVQAPGMR